MDKSTLEQLRSLVEDIENEFKTEERQALEDTANLWEQNRREQLKRLSFTQIEQDKIIEAEKTKLAKKSHTQKRKAEMDLLEEVAKNSLSADERRHAKNKLTQMKNAQATADFFAKAIENGINSAYTKITAAADYYSGLVSKIQTRLIGSSNSFSSISDTLSKTFAVSPFFSMKSAMDKTAQFIDAGIAFNLELRSSMAVLSEKVANTFNAFDSSLIRLIKLQQQDSTQARLGMENILTEFLNKNFDDTQYLQSLSDTVSANLLEATGRMSRETATEFDLTVQKWLGAFSSIGVSDTFVTKLAGAIGQLASGDIQGLSGDTSTQALLVASANAAGLPYGDMLLKTPSKENINSLFEGILKVLGEINDSGSTSLVALNQYAKVFGLSVSDLTASVKNLTQENFNSIKELNTSYDDMVQRVKDESTTSKLWGRTGGGELVKNLVDNMFLTAGRKLGTDAGSYLLWQGAGLMNQFLDGITTGVEVAPFGVGTKIDLTVGKITKAVTVAGALAAGMADIGGALSSIKGINFDGLKDASNTGRRSEAPILDTNTLLSSGESANRASIGEEGLNFGEASMNVDYSADSMYAQAKTTADFSAQKVSDGNYKEEEAKAEAMQKNMLDIGDNVAFIVRMLNDDGIVIRGRAGMTEKSYFTDLASQINGEFISR